MLTLVKVMLISTLFSGSFGKENSGKNTTQSNIDVLQGMANETLLLEDAKFDKENRESSNTNTSDYPALNLLNKTHVETTFSSDLSIDSSPRSVTPASTFPVNTPLVHGFVSKLPTNSSVLDEHSLLVSASPNSTPPPISSEKFTSSLNTSTNDTMNAPNSSSTTVSNLPRVSTNVSVTPLIMEPTTLLTTTSNSWAGFTAYEETTTLQPTLKFTNSSKFFPNTADPQEENRNTGVVFGAILGTILGASLLSLVGYLLCGKRKTDSFSHRRLYDDRNEPVLRLDNAPEPYDVSFGNSNYYNRTVIESSMSEGQEHARDGIPMDDIPPLRTSV